MSATTSTSSTRAADAVARSGLTGGRRGIAHAFAGGDRPRTVAVQAAAALREEPGRVVVSGVPGPRVQQTLRAALTLPGLTDVPRRHLHLDVHRGDEGTYRHHYGLALAVAIASALGCQPVPEGVLFVGDVGLDGRVTDVPAKLVDGLNDALATFVIETPVTILLAPGGAAWVDGSSTVRVVPVETLARAVGAIWPNARLRPW